MAFNGVSDYIKVAYLLVISTSCVLIIVFFTPYWTTSTVSDAYAGLWVGCNTGLCYDRYNLWVEEWIKATQAFVLLSMLCAVGEVFFTTIYIFHAKFESDKRFIFMCMVMSFTTSLFMFLAVVIWGGSQHLSSGETLSYCFAFAVLTAPVSAVTGVLYLLELKTPVFLGEDQQALLERVASMPIQSHAVKVTHAPEQGNNPLDLTTDRRGLNMSMKSGLNTSVYLSKQPSA